MRAVNLLPQKHRPAAPTGRREGSAYVILGVLGTLLVAVVLYVLTVNSIATAQDEVAQARKETSEAEAKTRALQPYGDFSSVAQTRLQSVKSQAQSRIDWERLVRELAHLLPEGSWLTSADATVDPAASAGSSGGAGASTDAAGPQVHVFGCAHDQQDVATTLVRLRRITGATDVKLTESTQGEEQTTDAGQTGEANPEDCGVKNGRPNYKWDAVVTFDPAPASGAADTGDGSAEIPARLGGGS